MAGGLELGDLQGPFQPKPFCDILHMTMKYENKYLCVCMHNILIYVHKYVYLVRMYLAGISVFGTLHQGHRGIFQ